MKNKLPNLVDLMAFIEIAKGHNFHETAAKLGVSQPAISQKINRLEDRFGVKLFRRRGHKMQLTEAGKVLEPMSRDLFRLACHVDETMTSIQGEIVSEVIIGCSTALGKYFLTRLIAAFRIEYPFVSANIECIKKSNVLEKLSTGEAAVIITSKKYDQPAFEHKILFADDVILIVPDNHAWAGKPFIVPDELLNEPIILREESAGSRELLLEALKAYSIFLEDLPIAMELGNAEAIENAVEEGIGIAFMSRKACSKGVKFGRIVEVHVEGLELKREIYMVRSKTPAPTRLQQIFWEFVVSQNVLGQMHLNQGSINDN